MADTKSLKNAFDNTNKAEEFDNSPVPIEIKGSVYDYGRASMLVSRLCQSPHGKKLVQKAHDNGYHIEMLSGMRSFGSMCEKKKRIALNPSLSQDQLVATLAHECRHAGQFSEGVELEEDKLTPKSFLMMTFAIEADANVNTAIVATELKERGDDAVWNSFEDVYEHIAKPFKEKADKGGIETGEAQMAAFDAWYAKIGNRSIYENSYTKRLRDKNRVKKDDNESFSMVYTPEHIVETVCKQGEDGNYFKKDPKVLESKQYLDAGHEQWWAIWRFYKDQAFSQPEKFDPDKNMKEIPKRENNGDEYCGRFELPPPGYKEKKERQEEAKEKIAAIKQNKAAKKVALKKAFDSKQK